MEHKYSVIYEPRYLQIICNILKYYLQETYPISFVSIYDYDISVQYYTKMYNSIYNTKYFHIKYI